MKTLAAITLAFALLLAIGMVALHVAEFRDTCVANGGQDYRNLCVSPDGRIIAVRRL